MRTQGQSERITAIVLFLGLLIGGCRQRRETMHFVSSAVPFALRLDARGCSGRCPQYRLTVHADGSADLEAIQNLPLIGHRHTHLNVPQVRWIVRKRHFFASFPCAHYSTPLIESVRISVTDGSVTKAVDCSLNRSSAGTLEQLADDLEALVINTKWSQSDDTNETTKKSRNQPRRSGD